MASSALHASQRRGNIVEESGPVASPSSFPRLPPEIWANIVSNLAGRDIKNLRLANRLLERLVPLRIDRVFLSPNPLNIRVFRAIASHPVYRHGVVEIVYDDARLLRSSLEEDQLVDWTAYSHPDWGPENAQADDGWFRTRREDNVSTLWSRHHNEVDRPEKAERQRQLDEADGLLPEGAAWAYYQDLVDQQDTVIACNDHVKAFQLGLERFPRLQRVTITPLAHGFLFTPGYETPMIRSFPRGFNYPIPRGWPNTEYRGSTAEALPWASDRHVVRSQVVRSHVVRAKWQGYCAVTSALAEHGQLHNIAELIVEGCPVGTGLNVNLFGQPSQDFDNLVKIVSQKGFRRLDLSLIVGNHKHHTWCVLRSGMFREAVSRATQLQSMSLATDLEGLFEFDDEDDRQPLPLSVVFPPWTHLQHFRLWNFIVSAADLIDFLSQMPQTLERAELVFLKFFDDKENHRRLLEEMREKLSWTCWQRRPNLRIAVDDLSSFEPRARAHWLETEVDDFLYTGGRNPFGLPDGSKPDCVLLRDAFDASYAMPWAYYAQHDMAGNVRASDDDREYNTPAVNVLP